MFDCLAGRKPGARSVSRNLLRVLEFNRACRYGAGVRQDVTRISSSHWRTHQAANPDCATTTSLRLCRRCHALCQLSRTLFALLCGEAGVTCNDSSAEDNAGWDYIVQFPCDPDDQRPKDVQVGAETSFVQVKSTDAAPFAVNLKLSNALRMAKEPQPYFLVLIVGAGSARRILARHFWVNEIEDTLRRVRQAEVSGHRDRLNRRTLTLRLTNADDHTNDLLQWMHSTIHAVRGDYRVAKAMIANSVGYDRRAARFSVTFTGSPGEIADWELGLSATPPV